MADPYGEFKSEDNEDIMVKMSNAAEELLIAKAEVDRLEEELKKASAYVRDIGENLLPDLMDEVGIKSFKTKNSVEISTNERIRVSIPRARHNEAMQWLIDNGDQDLLTNKITLDFGMNQLDSSIKFETELKQRNPEIDYEVKRTIHHSTLSKCLKDHLANGSDVPMSVFGAFRHRYVTVKSK